MGSTKEFLFCRRHLRVLQIMSGACSDHALYNGHISRSSLLTVQTPSYLAIGLVNSNFKSWIILVRAELTMEGLFSGLIGQFQSHPLDLRRRTLHVWRMQQERRKKKEIQTIYRKKKKRKKKKKKKTPSHRKETEITNCNLSLYFLFFFFFPLLLSYI